LRSSHTHVRTVPPLPFSHSPPTKMRTAALFTIVSTIHHTGRAFQIGLHPANSVTSYQASNVLPRSLNPTTLLFSSASTDDDDDNSESSSAEEPILDEFHAAAEAAAPATDQTDSSKVPPINVSAESILDEFHQSNLLFRIVVIGNGAILETTSKLGPTSKSSISPKSGERLLTFASDDQSFEFHVKVEQVCKIAFVSNKRRVARFLSENGTPICSLILVDSSNEAEAWFDGLVEKHGDEVLM